jgi:hypothetical protein
MSPDVHGKTSALITGGAGQDGLSRGYNVAAHSRHHVEPVVHSGRVTWHVGDLADDGFLGELLTSPELVAMMVQERIRALSSCCNRPVGIVRVSVARQMKD